MKTVIFDLISYEADTFLDSYELHKKPSSNIDFFGFDGTTLFVQFKNGSCWLYYIDAELVEELLNPGPGPDGLPLSIGKIIANKIVRKRLSQSIPNNLVKMLPRPIALMKSDYKSQGNVLLASKHEEVYIVLEDEGMIQIESKVTGKRWLVTSDQLLKKAI